MAKNGLVRQVLGDLPFSNSSPLANLLDRCIQSKSLTGVRRVHARILKSQFAFEVFVQNRLIGAYAKCGCIVGARKVFDRMPHRNTFTYNSVISAMTNFGLLEEALRLFSSAPNPDQCSWNSMVSGFAQHGRFEEATEWLVKMHKEDFRLNEYSFGSAISACSGLLDLKMGVQVHGLLSKSPYLMNVYMGSALVDMYAKCGDVGSARKIFDGMREKNVVTWNSLITCYEQNGPASEALQVFVRMMECGVRPDEVTLASVVSACATLMAIREGRQIHGQTVKVDEYRNDTVLCNALVDMYAKCGRIAEARWIFDKTPARTVVSETSMVSGYARASSVEAAKSLFYEMEDRNVVSWNALMAGYTQNGGNEEALGLFCQMKRKSVWPTHYTFGNLVNACANLANLNLGRQAHTHVLKYGCRFQSGPESDLFVGNALIDMYMKCGSVEDGFWVFKHMSDRDCVSWNAVIVGYAQNGYGVQALDIYRKMLEHGGKPDHVTFIGVLCACSHAGFVEEGRHYFYSMTELHGLVPWKDHYTCMVDLLGRAGCLEEARNFIEAMPIEADNVVWASLLAACRVHRNIDIGKHAAEKLMEIDPTNSSPYVLLSNMYAEHQKWGDVNKVRNLMRQQGVVKQPGCSWIEVQNNMHVFMVKDKRHPRTSDIYLILKRLTGEMKLAGYVPADDDLQPDEEESVVNDPLELQAIAAAA